MAARQNNGRQDEVQDITGLLSIGLLVAFLRGNHIGHVEDLFVIGFALLGAFFLVRDWWGRRRGWLR